MLTETWNSNSTREDICLTVDDQQVWYGMVWYIYFSETVQSNT